MFERIVIHILIKSIVNAFFNIPYEIKSMQTNITEIYNEYKDELTVHTKNHG